MNTEDDDKTALLESAEVAWSNLINRMFTLQLATSDTKGDVHCGYTPYVFAEPCSFYVFVSQLSAHTRDMLATRKATVLIIEDEGDASQRFARTRVTYQCEVVRVDSKDAEYSDRLDQMTDRHGKMMTLLRQLPDFELLRLMPVSGQFVMGFGKAFRLTGLPPCQFEHTRSG